MGPETTPTIARIAEIVRGYTNVFVVKGHTTPDEERRAVAEKRDLGYERANAVTAALVAQGVARTSLRVQSCRDYEPRAEAAYSDASRAANRRVEVFATEALVSEFQGDPAIVPQAPETTR
jgi:flagellar motor protein MotB